ncbi:MAG: 30S ribosomal protein S1 [Fimbriimonadia bacterium]|jgi:4-hydroxy-3-methylbut-2-enyl diphosphate reductase
MIDEELEPGIPTATPGDDMPTVAESSQPEPTVGISNGEEEPASMEEALQDDTLRREYDQSFRRLSRGQLLRGTVVHVEPDRVFVDMGGKTEGIIPLAELSAEPLTTAEGVVNLGDEISVVVLNPEGADGNPVLSKKRADFEDWWAKIERCYERQEIITALVTERVKGGLVVDIGVRGFVPATHVGNGKLRNIERFVGQSLPLRILEIDRERRKVVLSNRLAEEERREEAKHRIFGSLRVGEVVDGVVRRIVDYGAFVDIGGVDGLLHVSEMSWTRINHPSEVLKEGDEIKVKILRLDQEIGKISLGYRQVQPDPWSIVADKYKVGQVIEVPVSRLVQSGAFVKLEEGVEAWLPVSEMAHRRVSRPSEVVTEGQTIQCQVMDIRAPERRMVVSLRALERHIEREAVERHGRSSHKGGATIGERVGALKEMLTRKSEETAVAKAEHSTEEAPAPEAASQTESVPEPAAEEPVAPEPPVAEEPASDPEPVEVPAEASAEDAAAPDETQS